MVYVIVGLLNLCFVLIWLCVFCDVMWVWVVMFGVWIWCGVCVYVVWFVFGVVVFDFGDVMVDVGVVLVCVEDVWLLLLVDVCLLFECYGMYLLVICIFDDVM